MCNYISAFPLQFRSGNWGESLACLSSSLLKDIAVDPNDEDNRGSGR